MPDLATYQIYAICDPASGAVRHVGRSKRTTAADIIKYDRFHFAPDVRDWLDEMLPDQPVVDVLETVEGEREAHARKSRWVWWIAQLPRPYTTPFPPAPPNNPVLAETFYVYALKDPHDCVVRWVGVTQYIDTEQTKRTRAGYPLEVCAWLDDLLPDRPIVEVLEKCPTRVIAANRRAQHWLYELGFRHRPVYEPPPPPPPPPRVRPMLARVVEPRPDPMIAMIEEPPLDPTIVFELDVDPIFAFIERRWRTRPKPVPTHQHPSLYCWQKWHDGRCGVDHDHAACGTVALQYYQARRRAAAGLPPLSTKSVPPVEDEPTVRFVDVPECALVAAIRLRTNLHTYVDIAQRLTALGQPPGVVWQPADVRQLISAAFMSWPRDPTPKYR